MSTFFVPVFLGAFFRLLSHRRHLLLSLLSLEAIILALVISLSIKSALIICNFSLIIIFVFSVAEARLGLSVLVSMRRYRDSSFVSS